MECTVKSLFMTYLKQLEVVVEKVPDKLFPQSLSSDMFPLEMNAKIAANFLLRGYCPLVGMAPLSLMREERGKLSVLTQVSKTRSCLQAMPDIVEWDDSQFITDRAGTAQVSLCQSRFVYEYRVHCAELHVSYGYGVCRTTSARRVFE